MCNHDSPRVASRLGLRGARAFAALTHALPGSVYVYQGEELGLPTGEIANEFRQDPAFIRSGGTDLGRDGARVPLPWKKSEHAFGFTSGTPWLPQMSAYGDCAVDVEESDTSSYLNFYRKSFALRKEISEFGVNSSFEFIDSPAEVLAFKRGSSILVVANTGKTSLKMNIPAGYSIIQDSADESSVNGTELHIASESTVWLQAK